MRLNHDYVRDILLFIEKDLDYKDSSNPNYRDELPFGQLLVSDKFSKYNKEELTYALELLTKEGFNDCAKNPYFVRGSLMQADIIGLTWSGHQLLDNIRNDTVWNAVKEKSKKFGKFSLNTLATCAGQLTIALMSNPNAVQNFLDGVNNIGNMV